MYVPFHRVVIAFDGSEGGKKALILAESLLRKNSQMELTIAVVYEERIESRQIAAQSAPQSNSEIMQGYIMDGIQVPSMNSWSNADSNTHTIIENSVEKIINEAKEILNSQDQSRVTYKVLEGDPAECICDYAKEIGADLIITGQSGKGGFKRMILGTVSEKVVKNSSCHVLIAK